MNAFSNMATVLVAAGTSAAVKVVVKETYEEVADPAVQVVGFKASGVGGVQVAPPTVEPA
jgi:hypothetical protein